MLDKTETPAFDDLIAYCGDSGALWLKLDDYLSKEFEAVRLIRFPYGKKYGWSAKYSRKSKHICDVFAENGAFTVFCKISASDYERVEGELTDYSKGIWGNAYQCGDGGWINYRIFYDSSIPTTGGFELFTPISKNFLQSQRVCFVGGVAWRCAYYFCNLYTRRQYSSRKNNV